MHLSFQDFQSPSTSKAAPYASSQAHSTSAHTSRDVAASASAATTPPHPNRDSMTTHEHLPGNSLRAKALKHATPPTLTQLKDLLSPSDSPEVVSASERHVSPRGEEWARAETAENPTPVPSHLQMQYARALRAVQRDEADLIGLIHTAQKTGRLVRIEKTTTKCPTLKKLWNSVVSSTPVSESQLYRKLEQLKESNELLEFHQSRRAHYKSIPSRKDETTIIGAEQNRIQKLASAIETTIEINNLKTQIKSESLEIRHLGEGNLAAIKEKIAILHSHEKSRALADKLEKKYFKPALNRAIESLKKTPNFSDLPYVSSRLRFRQDQQKADLASVNQHVKPSKVKELRSMPGPDIIDLPDNAWQAKPYEVRKLRNDYDVIIQEIRHALSLDPEAANVSLIKAESALQTLQNEGFGPSKRVGWRIDQQEFIKEKKHILANAHAHLVEAKKVIEHQKSFLNALQNVNEVGRFQAPSKIKAAMNEHDREVQAYFRKTAQANRTNDEWTKSAMPTTRMSSKPQVNERTLYRTWTELQRAGLSPIAQQSALPKKLQQLSNDLAKALDTRRAMSEQRAQLIPIQKNGDGNLSTIEKTMALVERLSDQDSLSLPLEATFHANRAVLSVMDSIKHRAEHLRNMNQASTFSENGARTSHSTKITFNPNAPLHARLKEQVDLMVQHDMLFPNISIDDLASLEPRRGSWEITKSPQDSPSRAFDASPSKSSPSSTEI